MFSKVDKNCQKMRITTLRMYELLSDRELPLPLCGSIEGPPVAKDHSSVREKRFQCFRTISDNCGIDFWLAKRSFPPHYCPHIQSLAECFLPSPLRESVVPPDCVKVGMVTQVWDGLFPKNVHGHDDCKGCPIIPDPL